MSLFDRQQISLRALHNFEKHCFSIRDSHEILYCKLQIDVRVEPVDDGSVSTVDEFVGSCRVIDAAMIRVAS